MLIVDLLKFSFQKKNMLSALLCWTGFLRLKRLSSYDPKKLVILAYHRVMPEMDNYPFDHKLISATPEQFEWQVKYIKENYNLISFEDLIRYKTSNIPLPPRAVIITFDDGFDDNYIYAYPILKKYNAKACFFISTDYIGTNKIFWFDWVAFLCNKAKKNITLTSSRNGGSITLNASDDRAKMVDCCLSFLKCISNADRKQVIKQLETKVETDAVASELSRAMSWEQVRKMHASGLAEIGSHAKSHAILSQLSQEELVDEVCDSREIISKKISASCQILSYPVGGDRAYNETVVNAVKNAGYDYAVTYMPGLNMFGDTSDYLLKRLHAEKYLKPYRFKAMLEFPKHLW